MPIRYKDLKSPSSPAPTPPPSSKPTPDATLGSTKAVELDALEATLEVDDMKLPMSPTPTLPGYAIIQINAAQVETSTTTTTTEVSVEVPKTRHLSPYAVYEDLKPPTSQSPFQATAKGRITNVTLPVEAAPPSMETRSMETTHLSPYHAYDDLKPPNSPSPSLPTVSFSSQPKISGTQIPAQLKLQN